MLAIRLDPALEKRLARLAQRTGRTKTYYAREAIVAHLDELERAHRSAIPKPTVLREEPPARRRAPADFAARLRKIYGDRVTPDSRPLFDEMRAERF